MITESIKKGTIYTIGHSTHEIKNWISFLKRHWIDVVADVRSVPYSRRQPQFNRENLINSLKIQGIAYVFLGKELGARTDDPNCYENGRVKYRLIAKTKLFKEGIERIRSGSKHRNIALMCAEKDPLDCHRTILVARELARAGSNVVHILADGRVEPHSVVMKPWLEQLGADKQRDLFLTGEQLMDKAYAAREQRIAYANQEFASEAREVLFMRILTIGFTKKSAQSFFETLLQAGVRRLVDVRLNNVSQLAGFAKKNDLAYFLDRLCYIDYVHFPILAPTKEMLDAYKKKHIGWKEYERYFINLMAERQIEDKINPKILEDACLLCSEEEPHYCHRRLVAEYLKERWGNVKIEHLGYNLKP